MFHLFKTSIVMGFALLLVSLNSSPSASGQTTQSSSATVTAASSNGSLRFSAPGNTTQIRLEVFSPTGEKVFDSGNHDGNVLDWRWQDLKAQGFSTDSYVCLVTVQNLSGKSSRKLAALLFANEQPTLQPVETAQLTPAQTQAVGATEADTPLTIITSEPPIAATVIAHDGTNGQMIRGRGALTFRIGDFFSGADQEQMRLTEAGNLGIGTSDPKGKLDVAGTIRAERFLVAKPKLAGADQTTALNAPDSVDAVDAVQPLATGTGTLNQIAKWIDNAGTLGDSIITGLGTNIGIGTTSPGFLLDAQTNSANNATMAISSTLGSPPANVGFLASVDSLNRGRYDFFWNSGSGGLALRNGSNAAGNILFFTNSSGTNGLTHETEKARIDKAGNLGLGTSSPGFLLDAQTNSSNATIAISSTLSSPPPNVGFLASVDSQNRGRFDFSWNSGSGGLALRNGSNTAGNILFFTNSSGTNGLGQETEKVRINKAGSVGIGTNTPTAKLDVAGAINASTQYNIAGVRVLDILGSNTFAGVNAGLSNAGTFNTFVGNNAGSSKNGGDGNSFFGGLAGNSNSGGNGNAFFGFETGKANINGESNSFFGAHAGRQNQNAAGNSFFGYLSGEANTSGEFNSFFGKEAGSTNTTGSFNVSIGYAAGTGPFAGNASGTNNVSIGYAAGTITGAGQSGNNNNIFIGAGARGDDQEDDNQPLTYATAIGADAVATRKNTIFLGRSDLEHTIENPDGGDDVVVGGTLFIKSISHPLGGLIDLCVPDGPHPFGYGVVTCSSSLRYKTDVQTFLGGLDIVRRLRPITFNWRGGGSRDLGFGAEEVEKIDPLLVVHNEKGEVEGVKYRQMTAVLVNAINEQQTQITEQQRTIEQQKLQLEQKDLQLESLKASVARQESRLAAVESRLKSVVGTRAVNKPSPRSRPNQ